MSRGDGRTGGSSSRNGQWTEAEELILRTDVPLYRGEYRVKVEDATDDRWRVTLPTKDGRLVLMPLGTPVAVQPVTENAQLAEEHWTKVVDRKGGREGCLEVAKPRGDAPLLARRPKPRNAVVVAVGSGKGGVGKSVLVSNLAAALAKLGQQVCMVDAVPGSGSLGALLNVHPRWGMPDVLAGHRTVFEAVVHAPGGSLLLGGGLAGLSLHGIVPRDRANLVRQFQHLSRYVDVILVDAGTGLDERITDILSVADRALVLTTPDPHAITDTYSLLHQAALRGRGFKADLVLNLVEDEHEARFIGDKMKFAAERYLGAQVELLGYVPRDRAAEQAVRRQRLVVEEAPRAAAAQAILGMAQRLLGEQAAGGQDAEGGGRGRWRRFWRRAVSRWVAGI